MSNAPPTPLRPATPRSRWSGARWSGARLAGVVVALAALTRDAPGQRLAAPIEATEAPTAAATPTPTPEPGVAFEVRFEAAPAADGTVRPFLGSLRVENDDGDLLRELEVQGDRVSVLDLPAGPYVLRAHVAGFARVARAIRTPHEPFVIPLEPIARVAGQVLGVDGQPHLATLRIVGSGIWPGRELQSDADGRFVFEDVPPGIYEVEATSDALVAEPRRGLTVDPEASVFVSLRLAAGAFASGVVVDRAGHPVPSAEIVAATSTLSASTRAVLSDANGAFRVGPFEPGAVVLDVRAAGLVTTSERCQTSAPCRVMLSEGATLRGRVLDEAHEPIADAWVEVVGEATDRAPIAVSAAVLPLAPLVFSPTATPADSALPPLPPAPSADEMPGLGVTDQVPPIPLAPGDTPEVVLVSAGAGGAPTVASPAAVVRTSLRTNAEGEFVVTGLPPGRVEVIARAPGHRAARSPRLQLAGGRTREGLELVLGAGGDVHGRVLDEHGRAADARIEARIENDPIPRYLSTDARGEFRLEDVGGAVLLFAMSEGRPTLEQIVEVRGGRTEEVAITLDAGRRTLRARVLDPHGDPIEDALVRIESLTAGTGQPRTLVSDANGEIELAAAPPGALSLEASHPAFVSAPVITRDDGLVTLTLLEPVSIATTLLDAWSGAAVADAEITWTCLDDSPCHRSTASDTNGVVDLPRARPGRYRVEVRASGYAPFARELTIRTPRRGDLVELDPFVIEPGLRVTGDVVDRFGRPVETAEITVDASDARDALVVRTDARGHFELTGVPAGRRVLSIVHVSAGEAVHSLDIRRDRDPAPIVIHLPERFDGDAAHGDRARRVLGIGIELEATEGALRISRVVGAAARRAGLVPGDELVGVDAHAVATLEEARERLVGSRLIPALLEVRRGTTTFFVRTSHELH